MTKMCDSLLDFWFVVGFLLKKIKSQLNDKCYNALLNLLARIELVGAMTQRV